MGRQPYITTLALGRSPYEPLRSLSRENFNNSSENRPDLTRDETPASSPGHYVQQYDSRGYPQNLVSRLLSRQSRRAQNEVLASVGICIGKDRGDKPMKSMSLDQRSSAKKSNIEGIRRENGVGLLITAVDLGLFCLASACFLGLRHRMQAFRFYANIPILEVLKVEGKHLGPAHFFLDGAPATLTYHVLDLGRFYFIESLHSWFMHRVIEKVGSSEHRRQIGWIMEVAKNVLRIATFTLVAPLEIFATLQRLALIPGWPLLPNPLALIPFTSLSPVQAENLPSNFSLSSSVQLLTALISSPLPIWWILFYAKIQVDKSLYNYMSPVLPKPENPDFYSLEGADIDNLDRDSIPGLGLPHQREELTDRGLEGFWAELKKDVLEMARGFWELVSRLRKKGGREELAKEGASDYEEHPLAPVNTHSTFSEISSSGPPAIVIEHRPETPIPFDSSVSLEYVYGDSQDQGSNNSYSPRPGSFQSNSPSPMPRTFPAPPPDVNTIDPLTSRNITPTPGLDSTTSLPYRSEINEELSRNNFPNAPGLPNTTATTASKEKTAPSYHRVTALTAHLAASLSSHLASHIASILFLPLESFFVRAVALNYLSLPSPPFSGPLLPSSSLLRRSLRREVFPTLTMFGAGLQGGWSLMGNYMSRIALCVGMEVVLGHVIWQLGAGVVWWAGKSWFAWRLW